MGISGQNDRLFITRLQIVPELLNEAKCAGYCLGSLFIENVIFWACITFWGDLFIYLQNGQFKEGSVKKGVCLAVFLLCVLITCKPFGWVISDVV